MTTSTDLDAWADTIAARTGLPVTRDPDLVFPPCLYLDTPAIAGMTLAAVRMVVPVYLVAPFTGKQAGDWLVDNVADVLAALGQDQADPTPLSVNNGDATFPATLIQAAITITKE